MVCQHKGRPRGVAMRVGAQVDADSAPFTGSEDFADMLQQVPGAYGNLGHAGTVPLHNPGFVLDEGILPVGASIYARLIERRLPLGDAA